MACDGVSVGVFCGTGGVQRLFLKLISSTLFNAPPASLPPPPPSPPPSPPHYKNGEIFVDPNDIDAQMDAAARHTSGSRRSAVVQFEV